MPKELLCIAKGKVAWAEYDEPPLAADQVRVRTEFAAAKHGTEIAGGLKGYAHARGAYDGRRGLFTLAPAGDPYGRGVPVGNMAVGRVIEAGAEAGALAVGDRVLTYGGFRQTHVRPARNCWALPDEVPWQSAVCLDPADFAFAAVRDGNVRIGDAVAVLGMGAIGLMAVQIARLAGAHPVIASEPVAARRLLAARLGADVVLDSHACDVGLEVRSATGGRGADVVIDYSGAMDAFQDALRGVAHGGTVVAGAFPAAYPAGLDLGAEAHINIPQIVFSRSCSSPGRDHPRWDERRVFETCLRLIFAGRLDGRQIVIPVVPFEDLAEHYVRIADQPDRYVKLGVAVAGA